MKMILLSIKYDANEYSIGYEYNKHISKLNNLLTNHFGEYRSYPQHEDYGIFTMHVKWSDILEKTLLMEMLKTPEITYEIKEKDKEEYEFWVNFDY